ncbi:Putative RxLR effector [Phytophthora palmivora]|uniref:RxLR effector n=1 Tax=Phytophthora palmivora TaxID=4796 RepID=A0A2P4YPX2_9STRA|nr:Putative RxLR effector [Phytophthora palmivora]
MRWILLVWLATLVPCSVADLTTISDPNKFTAVASDDTLVVKRLLRSESNAATDNPTIAKDN